MSRFKMPTPPSERPIGDGRTPGWQDKLHEFVRHAVVAIAEDGETDAGAMRSRIIRFAREALGDSDSDSLRDRIHTALTKAGDYSQAHKNFDGMPGILRMVIEENVPDWSEPFAVESVMVEIQRALDADFSRRLGLMARRVATIYWHGANCPPRKYRTAILEQVLECGREAVVCDQDSIHRHTSANGNVMTTCEGALRSLLNGFDLSNPEQVASCLEIIERSARSELSERRPGEQHGWSA